MTSDRVPFAAVAFMVFCAFVLIEVLDTLKSIGRGGLWWATLVAFGGLMVFALHTVLMPVSPEDQ